MLRVLALLALGASIVAGAPTHPLEPVDELHDRHGVRFFNPKDADAHWHKHADRHVKKASAQKASVHKSSVPVSCAETESCKICTAEHECSYQSEVFGDTSLHYGNYANCLTQTNQDKKNCPLLCDCKPPPTECNKISDGGTVTVYGCVACEDHHPCTMPYSNYRACRTDHTTDAECADICGCHYVPPAIKEAMMLKTE